MDLNTAVQGTIDATKAVFNGAGPTTIDAVTNITNTVGGAIISAGTGAVNVLQLGTKGVINFFFPGTIA